ncbi:serine hydrolase [Actinokineospora sp. 24-640]
MGRRLIGRRNLLGGAVLFGAGVAFPGLLPRARAVAADFPFVAYHGLSAQDHQARFDELSPLGYRMISVSAYGSPPLYAAVWVQRAGPAWAAFHGVPDAEYQGRFDQLVAQGLRPLAVSATGSGSDVVFAAVFESSTVPGWQARDGLVDGPDNHPGTLAAMNRWARDNDHLPIGLTVYGAGADDRRYAGIWVANTTGTRWVAHGTGDADAHQVWFDAYLAAGLRPRIVDANDGHQYAAIFSGDSVGAWTARHRRTSAEYQADFDAELLAGRMPISVQGSGTRPDLRLSAVFAATDLPINRRWTQITAVGDPTQSIHRTVRTFMQRNGIYAGVLAVRGPNRMMASAGYTWAEPGYPITQPTSLMRLASVSKAFTSAAIYTLVTSGALRTSARVFPLLGITSVALPSQVKDPRIDDITVLQLLDHTAGWVRRTTYDPADSFRRIARELGLPGRASKRDVARYMYGEPLQYTPGAPGDVSEVDRYSNFGYILLGLVVEQVTGLSFPVYLRQAVLTQLGYPNDVLTGRTLQAGRFPTEVLYHCAAVDTSAWDPWSDTPVPTAYGHFPVESVDASGGLVATAPAVVGLINRFAAWGVGPRWPGSARSGLMPGTRSEAGSRPDNKDWAIIFNTTDGIDDDQWRAFITELATAISSVSCPPGAGAC